MKITKKLTAVTLVPAAAVGVAASSLAVVHAATDSQGNARAVSAPQARHARAGDAGQANPVAQRAATSGGHQAGAGKPGKPGAAALNHAGSRSHHKART